MADFLAYFTFFFVVLFLNVMDYKRFRTLVNPMFFVSVPFTMVLIICLVLNRHMNFVEFYAPSLWIWTVGLLLFWIGGICIESLMRKIKCRLEAPRNDIRNLVPYFIIAFSLLLLFMKSRSLSSMDLGSKEMGEEIGVGGIMGRVSNILILSYPLFAVMRFNRLLKIPLMLLMTVFLISLGSKTWIMSTILAAVILYFQTRNVKISLAKIGIVMMALLGLFFLYYSLNIDAKSSEQLVGFVSRHFYFYLTSGVLPMGEFFRLETPDVYNGLTLPFINIFKVLLGISEASSHSSLWFATDLTLGTPSNVFTFFGTIYIFSDTLGFVFYSLFLGAWCYFISVYSKQKDNVFLKIIDSLNIALLFFGWFNCTFFLLRIWEITVFCFMFYFISQYKIIFSSRLQNE